jgi:aspartate/methionine/tyrosine aminotransferase
MNLTTIERSGFSQPVNLADGHARQSLSAAGELNVKRRFLELLDASPLEILASEARFLDAFAARLNTTFPEHQRYLLYSASISVDLVGKLLARRGLQVHLMLPTFDNLPALMAMNGVQTLPVPDSAIYPVPDFCYLNRQGIQCLFLVCPNNPTGARLSTLGILTLLEWAAQRNVLTIFDMSFRLLVPELCIDLIAAADSIGASAIVIDDTGKVLSLFDSKLSVTTCTLDLARDMSLIHQQISLNVSTFDMEMLALLLDSKDEHNDEVAIGRQLITANRQILHDVLRDCGVVPLMNIDQEISVEWIRLEEDAEVILRICADRGLQILPGRLFYWDRVSTDQRGQFLRIALMRDKGVVAAGCEILRSVLLSRRSSAD